MNPSLLDMIKGITKQELKDFALQILGASIVIALAIGLAYLTAGTGSAPIEDTIWA